jgi:hypothetical protein
MAAPEAICLATSPSSCRSAGCSYPAECWRGAQVRSRQARACAASPGGRFLPGLAWRRPARTRNRPAHRSAAPPDPPPSPAHAPSADLVRLPGSTRASLPCPSKRGSPRTLRQMRELSRSSNSLRAPPSDRVCLYGLYRPGQESSRTASKHHTSIPCAEHRKFTRNQRISLQAEPTLCRTLQVSGLAIHGRHRQATSALLVSRPTESGLSGGSARAQRQMRATSQPSHRVRRVRA